MTISYDRSASEDLLAALEPGGWAHSLVEFQKASGFALDLQFRGYATKMNETWATLYVGLQKVLDLRHLQSRGFRLRAHSTLATSKNGWRSQWDRTWHAGESLSDHWSDVDLYLERVIPTIHKSHLVEGSVQAAICGSQNAEMLVIDREAAVTYSNQAEKDRVRSMLERPLLKAARQLGESGWRASVPTSLGGECDALALSKDGKLLAIEIKPRGATSTIRWSPLQVRHYADLFSAWVYQDHPHEPPGKVIGRMVDQRQRVGLSPVWEPRLRTPIEVQPMIAIGRGFSKAALDGLREVQGRLAEQGINTPPLLVKAATMWGRLDDIEL